MGFTTIGLFWHGYRSLWTLIKVIFDIYKGHFWHWCSRPWVDQAHAHSHMNVKSDLFNIKSDLYPCQKRPVVIHPIHMGDMMWMGYITFGTEVDIGCITHMPNCLHTHTCICVHARSHTHTRTHTCAHEHTSTHVTHTISGNVTLGSLKLYVSFAEYSLFYRALLQKRPIKLW